MAIGALDASGVYSARVFAPYALIDRTQLKLRFCAAGDAANQVHSVDVPEHGAPQLFSYGATRPFDGKLQVQSSAASEWSNAVSVDAVGASEVVTCRGVPGELDR